jgi:mannose-6-phosphate isomerase-like protein (cupin superfamily)
MTLNELETLHAAVRTLLTQQVFADAMVRLSAEIEHVDDEPFVWATFAIDTLGCELPASIKSCWAFVLKQDTPSGCHFHPNSVQHMVMIRGRGRSNVAGQRRAMVAFDTPGRSLAEQWYVIPQGKPHEFFPEGEHVTVVSFHTCAAEELEEVACDTGNVRRYESA